MSEKDGCLFRQALGAELSEQCEVKKRGNGIASGVFFWDGDDQGTRAFREAPRFTSMGVYNTFVKFRNGSFQGGPARMPMFTITVLSAGQGPFRTGDSHKRVS